VRQEEIIMSVNTDKLKEKLRPIVMNEVEKHEKKGSVLIPVFLFFGALFAFFYFL